MSRSSHNKGSKGKSTRAKASKNSGARNLHTKVKTAKGRKLSSTLWLERQLNDPYVAQAKIDGWRSRAAYKLLEMDDKYKLLRPGKTIIDLGSAPGGWSQIAAKRTQSKEENPNVIGLDILEMDPIPGVTFLKQDFTEEASITALMEAIGDHPVHLVMSDMAASTTGHRPTDHLRTIYLCELALDFACQVSAPGAHFIAKVLRGGTEHELLATMKKHYKSVMHIKPAASRQESVELYVLAKDFKG